MKTNALNRLLLAIAIPVMSLFWMFSEATAVETTRIPFTAEAVAGLEPGMSAIEVAKKLGFRIVKNQALPERLEDASAADSSDAETPVGSLLELRWDQGRLQGFVASFIPTLELSSPGAQALMRHSREVHEVAQPEGESQDRIGDVRIFDSADGTRTWQFSSAGRLMLYRRPAGPGAGGSRTQTPGDLRELIKRTPPLDLPKKRG